MFHVTIIGLNTLGGSLGMALAQAVAAERDRLGEVTIAGYDESRKAMEEALVRGAINKIPRNLEEAVKEVDLLIIAQPAQAVVRTMEAIGPLLPAGCVVTDTAGSKAQVLEAARACLPSGVNFIGGHPIPLPNREVDWEAGLKAADPTLFQDAVYCLIPAAGASDDAVDFVRHVVQLIGASPFFIDALEHDGLLAGLSHAPYAVVAAMLYTIASSSAWRDLKLLADPAFQRLNSVLDSWPADFHQTCLANRLPVISWLDRVIAVLRQVRDEVADEASRGEYLQKIVQKAREAHRDWTLRRDERRKELETIGGVQEVESARDTFVGLFIPGFLRRRPGEKKKR